MKLCPIHNCEMREEFRKTRPNPYFRCRKCETARKKEWCKNNPIKHKLAQFFKRSKIPKEHRISVDTFLELCKAANYHCAICKKQFGTNELNIDHCHKTGKLRSLLCTHCNWGLGQFRDNIISLLNAVEYIQEHE